jgi:hypothetical protein
MAVVLALGVSAVYTAGWQLSRSVPARIGPAPAELQAESVEFPSESGSMIRAWLSRGAPHKGVILLLPGVRSNRLSMVDRARLLHGLFDTVD